MPGQHLSQHPKIWKGCGEGDAAEQATFCCSSPPKSRRSAGGEKLWGQPCRAGGTPQPSLVPVLPGSGVHGAGPRERSASCWGTHQARTDPMAWLCTLVRSCIIPRSNSGYILLPGLPLPALSWGHWAPSCPCHTLPLIPRG